MLWNNGLIASLLTVASLLSASCWKSEIIPSKFAKVRWVTVFLICTHCVINQYRLGAWQAMKKFHDHWRPFLYDGNKH